MPRKGSSQWDFAGELFPVEATRKVFTVAALTATLRQLLEKHIGQVWVTGEVTNFRAQSSGHIYFTLKDSQAQLSCVMFRSDAVAGRELLADGRQVVLKGEMSVYEARGQYQLRVTAVELQGVGALQAAFEKLKAKLAAEGLFDPARKRPLPAYPQVIGLVTSPTGAAIRDVLHVAGRRNPALEIIFAASSVQGAAAAGEIVEALARLNQWAARPGGRLDAILLTRGGGSLEDLQAFNEESVARAVAASAVPVVSAVGHEIDFTICDFAADLRAATPSAAAELLTEGVFSRLRWIEEVRGYLGELVLRRVSTEARHCRQLALRLRSASPRRILDQRWQRLDDLTEAAAAAAGQHLRHLRQTVSVLAARLDRVKPAQILQQRGERTRLGAQRLRDAAKRGLREAVRRHAVCQEKLRLLGPEQVLARGYSITTDAATGAILREPSAAPPGKEIRTKLAAGELRSVVKNSR